MKIKDWSLDFFSTGEWQVIEERLDEYDQKLVQYNPSRRDLFAALRAVPYARCRVAIVGQDPYPKSEYCTGIAFSTPGAITPTLVNIFREYQDDLGYPAPTSGDLTPWCKQGVLLWNAIPTCATGKPASHHWPEWELLTKEIVEKLDAQKIPVVLLGNYAGNYARYITQSPVLRISHPSPLGAKHSFLGSHLFSWVNDQLGTNQIDWRLPHGGLSSLDCPERRNTTGRVGETNHIPNAPVVLQQP